MGHLFLISSPEKVCVAYWSCPWCTFAVFTQQGSAVKWTRLTYCSGSSVSTILAMKSKSQRSAQHLLIDMLFESAV